MKVGHFSYSLYLIHLLVVAGCYFLIRGLPLGPVAHLVVLIALATPASLAVAYAFHVLVERHFMQPPARVGRGSSRAPVERGGQSLQ